MLLSFFFLTIIIDLIDFYKTKKIIVDKTAMEEINVVVDDGVDFGNNGV